MTRPGGHATTQPSTITQRAGASAVSALSGLLMRLPDRPLHRVAHVAGAGLYLVQRRRRALVRANLQRACDWIVANGDPSPRIARAARDAGAMDRLVRSAFGHYVRYYLEVAIAPGYPHMDVVSRMRIDTPPALARAFAPAGPDRPPGLIFLGMHHGALELPVAYAMKVGGRPVMAPMETIGNPELQRYFERSRSGAGVRLISHRDGRAALVAALRRDECVALVADRNVAGRGQPVTLFGATARMPAGPGIVAAETGSPAYVAAVLRVGWGDYAASVVNVELPAHGRVKERALTFLERQVRAYEALIAAAPDQWWSAFFPIWQDDDA